MKPILNIVRLEEQKKYGIFGVLLIQNEIFCFTLEPPWLDNMKDISCIPTGQYPCYRIESNKITEITKGKLSETFVVAHVPCRDGIIIHPGNSLADTKGCILLGATIGNLHGNRAVLNSGNTFACFMALTAGHDSLKLTVKEMY